MNTIYYLNMAAGNLFRTQQSPSIPNEYWIGLSTTAPTPQGTNVSEPAGSTGYARVLLSSLSAPSGGVVSNTASITFNESTQSWGTITHFVIYDGQNAGNLLMYGALSTPRSVEAGTIMTIGTGFLNLSAQNPSA